MPQAQLIIKVYVFDVPDVAGSLKQIITEAVIDALSTKKHKIARGTIIYLDCSCKNPDSGPNSIEIMIYGPSRSGLMKNIGSRRAKIATSIQGRLEAGDTVGVYYLPAPAGCVGPVGP